MGDQRAAPSRAVAHVGKIGGIDCERPILCRVAQRNSRAEQAVARLVPRRGGDLELLAPAIALVGVKGELACAERKPVFSGERDRMPGCALKRGIESQPGHFPDIAVAGIEIAVGDIC